MREPDYLETRSGKRHVTTSPSRLWGVEQLCTTPAVEVSKLKFIESEIPPTRMTVRLATGAPVTVMKRVVATTYTLKELQYDDAFIVSDLNDKYDVILGLPWIRIYESQVS